MYIVVEDILMGNVIDRELLPVRKPCVMHMLLCRDPTLEFVESANVSAVPGKLTYL
jgi:hypothetical protein